MTTFGKILLGLMLATAAVLVIKSATKTSDDAGIVVEEAKDNSVDKNPETENKWSGDIYDLSKRGGDHVCTFSHSSEVALSTGTVYVSGEKIRGDFISNTKIGVDMKIESHMISDGDFVYSWSSMAPTGFKAKVIEGGSSSAPESVGFNYNQKFEYDCNAWNVDSEKFVVPSDVKFTVI
jgi:hypothetical protein